MTCTVFTFFWHMHQPYYRNMATGESVQPWVRLHGIKSYYDMIQLYEEFSDMSCEINFVPSLLKQIREYVEENMSDMFLEYSLTPAKELTPQQKSFILRNFFMANTEQMIKPYPRYFKLYGQRGKDIHKIDFESAIRYFSWQDYLDIQVYYNLAWFGWKAREELPQIEQMLYSRHFTEEDKKFVLSAQKKILAQLLNCIRNAPKNIELTTTPYYHPILPLLLDSNFAKRNMPHAALPERISLEQMAELQLDSGLKYFEETVGHRPSGIWPAEGSVCPEMATLLAKAGVKWFATDEDILRLSRTKWNREEELYQPYIVEHGGSQVTAIFRDRDISDHISFKYGKLSTSDALDDITAKISAIAKTPSANNRLVTILLDGENPWETYEGGGKPFLTGLFSRLREQKIPTTTISKYLSENPPKKRIDKLYTGSWINANFAIWIGKPQKNQAWGYIKKVYDELGKQLSGKALESFCAACGSDWFWWFDDDFDSAFKADFDRIFRLHLKNAYTLLGRDIPIFLFDPIHKFENEPAVSVSPPGFIYPVIDGTNTSFFEWANAARFDIPAQRGSFVGTNELLDAIYFGFNKQAFFIRAEHTEKNVTFHLHEGEELVIYIHNHSAKYKFKLFFDGQRYKMESVTSEKEGYSKGKIDSWGLKSLFEMRLKYSDLGYKTSDELTFIITVVREGLEVRRYSHIKFKVPDEGYESREWSV